MPFFRYAGTDPQGNAVHGSVQAGTPDEALQALRARGLNVQVDGASNPAPVSVPAYAPPIRVQPPASSGSSSALASTISPVIARRQAALAPPTAAVVATRRGTDKERFFLFSQLASYMRAGVNPAQAFGDVGQRLPREDYREAMRWISQSVGEGRSIADALARYPDLFPPHVVGTVRAGEAGGFLPEAFTAISQQGEAAHKFRRSLWMVWVVAIHAFLIFPVAWMAYTVFPRAFEITYESGADGFSGGLSAMGTAFWELFKWPIAPVAGAVYILAIVLYKFVNSRGMTHKRHGWSLRMPILGGRAKNEGLSLFSWILSKVAQAGVSPHRSWELGVESVPNEALKSRLRDAGGRLQSGERLSKAFFDSQLFPQEYAPMMATAEMTGDIPGTLQKLSELSQSEFELSTTKSKAAAWVMSTTAIAITAGIVLILLVVMWYVKLPETVLKDLEMP